MRFWTVLLVLSIAFSAWTASAACPAQPASVTVPADGNLHVCVPATTAAPITKVDILFKTGSLSRPLSYVPPAGQTQFAPDFVLTVPVPTDLRGTGSAELTATGPGGTSEVAVVPVTFRGFDAPAKPVLTQ